MWGLARTYPHGEAEIDADHSHWDIGDFGSALQDHEDNIFGLVNPSVDVEDDGDDHIEIPDDDGVDVDGEGWGADVVWGIPGEDDGPEPPDHWPFVGDGMGIPRLGGVLGREHLVGIALPLAD